jgi:hypothetical protein
MSQRGAKPQDAGAHEVALGDIGTKMVDVGSQTGDVANTYLLNDAKRNRAQVIEGRANADTQQGLGDLSAAMARRIAQNRTGPTVSSVAEAALVGSRGEAAGRVADLQRRLEDRAINAGLKKTLGSQEALSGLAEQEYKTGAALKDLRTQFEQGQEENLATGAGALAAAYARYRAGHPAGVNTKGPMVDAYDTNPAQQNTDDPYKVWG